MQEAVGTSTVTQSSPAASARKIALRYRESAAASTGIASTTTGIQ